MPSPKALQKQTILDDLVNQFADPLSFFRELIQNAIDAGSGQVDVYFDFEPDGAGDAGTMVVHVDDFGEGMNREIIETRLTRLFSSAKDDDYTKIGKFGIGFVSVFAIEPDAVCVDTGRTGESWRVLFSPDKTYELYALDRPAEGTQIRIIKQATRAEFDDFVERAREVVRYWCKYVDVVLSFEDEEIDEPFDVDSPCKIVHREEGTRLVMGLVDKKAAPFGYYNRGLTLKEGEQSPWPHVAFKIDSRYLEHTLTRDEILQDTNFHKAWALLEAFATERLPDELVDRIEQAANDPAQTAHHDRLCRLLVRWLAGGEEFRRGWEKRRLFATVNGGPVSARECARRADDDRLLLAAQASRLTQKLASDFLIVRAAPGGGVMRLVGLQTDQAPQFAAQRFFLADDCDATLAHDAFGPGAAALPELVERLVDELGGRLEYVGFSRFARPGAFADQMAVVLDDRYEPTPAEDVGAGSEANLRTGRQLIFNADDERVAKLLDVAAREPEFAALMLVKLLLLEDRLRPEVDSLLTTRAIERRERREGC